MLLLALSACLEPAREILRVQVDLRADRVTVSHRLEDVSSDGEDCAPTAELGACVAALTEDRQMIVDALGGASVARAAYELDGNELDLVLEFSAPVDFFGSAGHDQIKALRLLSVAEHAAGGAGKPGIAVVFEEDPARTRTVLSVGGRARLLRFLGKPDQSRMDLWLVDRGKASFDATITRLTEGAEIHHRLGERPGFVEAMKAVGLL